MWYVLIFLMNLIRLIKHMFFIVLLLLPFLTWKMLNIPYLVNLILIVLKS